VQKYTNFGNGYHLFLDTCAHLVYHVLMSHKKPAKEQTLPVGIRLPAWLLKEIDRLATEDRRSRSQWIELQLEKIVKGGK